MDGLIDSVKIYNYARTPAQIAWDYNKGAPVAHYQFDECEGSTAYDASGNGNNGTITIGATGTQASAGNCESGDTADAWNNGASGKWNSSMSFDGVDDYVSVTDPSDGSLDFGTSDFSISTWIKISEVSGHLIQKYQDNNINYELYVSSNGSVNLRTWTAGTLRDYVYSNASVITQGTWYHVVVVASRGTATTMYVDGKNVTSTQGTTTVDLSNSGALNMMWNKLGTDDKTSGQIDDVRIYNYALTAEQVKTLYNNNSAIRFE